MTLRRWVSCSTGCERTCRVRLQGSKAHEGDTFLRNFGEPLTQWWSVTSQKTGTLEYTSERTPQLAQKTWLCSLNFSVFSIILFFIFTLFSPFHPPSYPYIYFLPLFCSSSFSLLLMFSSCLFSSLFLLLSLFSFSSSSFCSFSYFSFSACFTPSLLCSSSVLHVLSCSLFVFTVISQLCPKRQWHPGAFDTSGDFTFPSFRYRIKASYCNLLTLDT